MRARQLLVAALLVAPAAGASERHALRVDWLGQRIDTTVDSALAQYYIGTYLHGVRADPGLDRRFDALHAPAPLPDRERRQRDAG
jgi:hypothetical protein